MRYGLVSFFVVYGVVAFVAARQEMTAFYLKGWPFQVASVLLNSLPI